MPASYRPIRIGRSAALAALIAAMPFTLSPIGVSLGGAALAQSLPPGPGPTPPGGPGPTPPGPTTPGPTTPGPTTPGPTTPGPTTPGPSTPGPTSGGGNTQTSQGWGAISAEWDNREKNGKSDPDSDKQLLAASATTKAGSVVDGPFTKIAEDTFAGWPRTTFSADSVRPSMYVLAVNNGKPKSFGQITFVDMNGLKWSINLQTRRYEDVVAELTQKMKAGMSIKDMANEFFGQAIAKNAGMRGFKDPFSAS